jgi:hypothetical protein
VEAYTRSKAAAFSPLINISSLSALQANFVRSISALSALFVNDLNYLAHAFDIKSYHPHASNDVVTGPLDLEAGTEQILWTILNQCSK